MTSPLPTEIRTPEDLQRAMKADFPPSPEQWRAITAPLSPVVVIAGAGSGKTTLMAARVVYLVLTGQVRPEEILGLTFTTKAAAELRQRVRAALLAAGVLDVQRSATAPVDEDAEVLEPTVATYNAYAAALLTDHGLRIGHEPDTRVITDAARYQLGARAVDRYDGAVAKLSDHPPTVIQNLLALDGAMSEHLVGPSDVLAFDEGERASFERALVVERDGKARKTYLGEIQKAIDVIDRRAELMGLVSSYRRLKADLGLMDFSDQIALTARLAHEQPDVGRAERQRFKVVLLDEYQDTSVAQATLLARLFGEGHAVMAVGDPNQAIYGWRGASVSNIINFPEVFPAADGSPVPVLPLTVNRRSDTRILDVANTLAAPLMATYGDKVAALEHGSSAPGSVRVKVFETHLDELAWLVEEVRATHAAGTPWGRIAVLSRDNQHGEAVFDALTGADVPVEIVGLAGLVRLPEIATVVATLKLVQDVTDNASLLSLLAGPRWAVGPRDLRLLGQRALELVGRGGRQDAETIHDQLVAIADGIDPAEIPCLDDALADPGEAPYSPEARERFGLLRAELRQLRAAIGEPLLDLVRRIIDVTGVDVELASSVSAAAAARRENLDLFVKAVADFQAVDGDVTLPALIAWLTAEDEAGNGLEVATPSEADSVKLLTVHRSKGLEWATVFCVGVGEGRFPSTQGRSLWTSSPSVLPAPLRGDAADLPQLAGHDKPALDAYRVATREHEAEEELRLGYVAFTRPEHHLWVTSFLWGTRKSPYGPSTFQATIRDLCAAWGEDVEWRDKPEKGATNPFDSIDPSRPWPVEGVGAETARRLDAAARVAAADPSLDEDLDLDLIDAARVADWDAEIERLLAEARADRSSQITVELPTSLSATALSRLREDPEGFARDLARPMPRPPAPAARFGTRFHAWVEARFGQQGLFDPDELSGRADVGIDDEADLKELVGRFEEGPFGNREPHAVEAPFALVLDRGEGRRQVVRGRIDAVYQEPDGSFLVVDWKTGAHEDADPLQLALYRLAWAELHDLDPARVRAAFYYVRTGRVVEPRELPTREEVEALFR
ncbi:ATP-dependent helicase [Nocardioides nitrophenolicus]|uniref:ATP-dependent helicase n=1 Tax=Nocardioides nitrophenolicus TaxID=60489 RepID=UPI00195B247D|nr:ATP-dependent DNA helicase [Nocardioides nitrophenolicus]MBM7515738.1 DNA helicase-2/ATP-dependent DNA helicase PcrA [Nocardioides nitrophenolicus]